MEKVVAKASDQPSGSVAREAKSAERDSPAFDLTPKLAETFHRPDRLPAANGAPSGGAPLLQHPVLRLQRSIGNRAVGQLLAAETAQREPDDDAKPEIQRQCRTCAGGDDEEQVQRKVSADAGPVHPMLAGVLALASGGRARAVQARSASSSSADPSNSAEVIPSGSRGQALDDRTRDFMESRFDADFSRVRVHTDAPAAQAAEAIHATAFTTSQDIYFASGKYAPDQSDGQRLLAHELAHTIQQSNGQGPTKLARKVEGVAIGHPDDPLEREADAAADRVMAAGPQPAPDDKSASAPERVETKLEEPETEAEPPAPAAKKLAAGEKTKQPPEEKRAGPSPKDALKPTEEGAPKKPGVDSAKAEKAAEKKGPAAAKAQAPAEPAGGAPAAPSAAPAAEPEAAADVVPSEPSAAVESPATAAEPEPSGPPTAKPEPAPAAAPEPESEEAPQATPETDAIAAPAPPAQVPTSQTAAPEPAQEPEQALEGPEPTAAEGSPEPAAAAPSAEAAKQEDKTAGPPPDLPGLEGAPEPGAAPESAAPAAEAPAPASPETPAPTAAEPEPAQSSAPPAEAAATPGAPPAQAPETPPQAEAQVPEAEVAELESHANEAAAAKGSSPEPESAPAPAAVEPNPGPAPAGVETEAPGTAAAGPAPDAGCVPSSDDTAAPPPGADAGAAGGGGGCGGGGGGAVAEPPAPAAPDVSGSDPAAAMGAIADLPPAQLQTALGGVSAAASKDVGQKKQELAANPPQMERPSGVPAQRDPSIPVVPPGIPPSNDPTKVERAPKGEAVPIAQPTPLPAPPPVPVQAAPAPKLPGEAELTDADSAKVEDAVQNLPTTDPALKATAGDPPTLPLAGDADPKRADEQRAKLDDSAAQAQTQGQQDVAQPMGENDIYPTVPKETLTASTDGEAGPDVLGTLAACAKGGSSGLTAAKAKGGGGGEGGTQEETLSIVAKEKKGDEIKASVVKAQGDMTSSQQEQAEKIAQEKDKSNKEIDQMVDDNAGQQKEERTKAREDSLQIRTDWHKEQGAVTDAADKDATKATADAKAKVADQQKSANEEAAGHIETGNKEANDARVDAEAKAKAEKEKNQKPSGGFLGWLSSKVTAFFDSVKAAIRGVFDAARKLVKDAIEKAKKLATAVIEKARQAVVDVIHAAGDVLIAIGDRVLAAFPNLRDRFRKYVQDRVKAAEDVVNKLADALKKGVQKALDLLGAAINAYLGLLECAYTAAVDAVASVVQGAIQVAKAVVQGLAAFAELIKDVAADPGQWISNLGAAVVDGLKNCFWDKFKTAVKNWFNSKVEEVLGLPIMIFQLLFKGCLKMAEIGKMAWQALKAAIPMVLVQLLIEKLVAMIVPAAGAILTIIEGLRAAWGTVSRIISAFELFFAFLKAVKKGNAGGQFASALAAAAVVVIDFVANWLLARLKKPASAVAGRLRALAQKIGKALRKGFGLLKKGVKVAAGAIKRGVQAVGRAIKRGAQAVGRGLKKIGQFVAKTKVGKAIARTLKKVGRAILHSKVGKAVQKAIAKVKSGIKKVKEKAKKWWNDRKKGTPEERLDRATAALQPKIQRLFENGASRIRLAFQFALWRVYYGLSQLKLQGSGDDVEVYAQVNPGKNINRGWGSRADIVREVLEIAQRHVATLADRPSLGGSRGGVIRTGPGTEPGEIGQALAGRSITPDVGKTVRFDVGGVGVFGRQGQGKSNVIIQGLGTYEEVEQKLAKQGFKDRVLGKRALDILATGQAGAEDKDVTRLIALLGVESGRAKVAGVTGPQALLGLERGDITSKELFSGREPGGLFPPSQEGYVATQRRTEARLLGPEGDKFERGTLIHQASQEDIARTVLFEARILGAKMGGEVFSSKSRFNEKAEASVQAFLRRIGRE